METPYVPVEVFDDEVQKQIKKEKDTFNIVKWTILICIAIIFIIFLINRPFCLWSNPLDEGLLGTYGDFIGGVVGTLVTLYSVYLLVNTLNNQVAINSNIVDTNKKSLNTSQKTLEAALRQIGQADQSLFDSKFNAYLKTYQDAVQCYSEDCNDGKRSLDKMVAAFRDSGFTNEVVYIPRTDAAVKKFEEFYAENRTAMSTHMRTLYLLMQLIADKGNISEEDRVAYAKCIRGQLSENEMLILRYNCYTAYGRNMQKYVNRYNLLKHLPTMSLLEFNRWRARLSGKSGYINNVDAFLLMLRKEIGELLMSEPKEGELKKEKEIDVSKNYVVTISFSGDNKHYIFHIVRFVQVSRYGYMGKPVIEKALDCFSIGELRQFFLDVHSEYFFCNNFSIYNGDNNKQRSKARISSNKDDKNEDAQVVICEVKSDYPIVLRNMQLENPN